MVDAVGIIYSSTSPLCAALCLTLLVNAFSRYFKIRLLRSVTARTAQATIQQKLLRYGGQSGPMLDVVYRFDAVRRDGASCRVTSLSIDIQPDIWDRLEEGCTTDVRYLPDKPDQCLLGAELRSSMCACGVDKAMLTIFFITIPGGGAFGLACGAFQIGAIYGIVAVGTDALILIIWGTNFSRIAACLERFWEDKEQVKEITLGTPDASKGAVLGRAITDNQDGAATQSVIDNSDGTTTKSVVGNSNGAATQSVIDNSDGAATQSRDHSRWRQF